MRVQWPKGKIFFLLILVLLYFSSAIGFYFLAETGIIKRNEMESVVPEEEFLPVNRSAVEESIKLSEDFVDRELAKENGHINLYFSTNRTAFPDYNRTNSEALSYYLLWNAIEGNKKSFDSALDFIEAHMMSPAGYLMWRLEGDDTVIEDGSNIASDADLRAIEALAIAEEKWKDSRYRQLIDRISKALEDVAVTEDNYLAPYGGVREEGELWSANEVWISYTNFRAFSVLEERRGDPWGKINRNMKLAVIDAQIPIGLYDSDMNSKREIENRLDQGTYSINSLWIMVRSAESEDERLQDSAKDALQFYKNKFNVDGELYSVYTPNGDPLSADDSPWVYALVGRAAIELGDEEFANVMIRKLMQFQDMDKKSEYYGAFVEGGENRRATQFTMQESILTLQTYRDKTLKSS